MYRHKPRLSSPLTAKNCDCRIHNKQHPPPPHMINGSTSKTLHLQGRPNVDDGVGARNAFRWVVMTKRGISTTPINFGIRLCYVPLHGGETNINRGGTHDRTNFRAYFLYNTRGSNALSALFMVISRAPNRPNAESVRLLHVDTYIDSPSPSANMKITNSKAPSSPSKASTVYPTYTTRTDRLDPLLGQLDAVRVVHHNSSSPKS